MAIPFVTFSNGNKYPALGLGTYFQQGSGDREKIYQACRDAIAAGYRHIDTAQVYDNEDEVGRAVNDAIKAGEVTREQLYITTKLWLKSCARDKVVPALRESLRKLNLDYVDLYLIHWPMPLKEGDYNNTVPDHDIDIHNDTWRGMEEAYKLGLAKNIGVSNYNSKQIDAVMKVAEVKPVTNQVECHPFLSQRKLIDHCAKYGIVLTAYSPLGGSPDPPNADPEHRQRRAANANFEVRKGLFENELILELAKKYNKSAGQIMVKYQIQRGLIVIPKSVTKSRIEDNANIFDFQFTKEEQDKLEALNQNLRYVLVKQVFGSHKNYPFDDEF